MLSSGVNSDRTSTTYLWGGGSGDLMCKMGLNTQNVRGLEGSPNSSSVDVAIERERSEGNDEQMEVEG